MIYTKFKTALTAAFISSLMLASFTASAELVTNGAFNGSLANGSSSPISSTGLPSDWSLVTSGAIYNSPDTLNATTNSGGILGSISAGFRANPDTSNDQGTWVGIGRNGTQNEQFGQTITGFTVNQGYTISWLEGNFGIDFATNGSELYNSANRIIGKLGGETFDSAQTIAVGSDWYSRSFSFTATQASYDLSFEIAGPASAYMSIDDVSIVANTVSAVPEPQTWALMGAGLMLVGFQSRKRKA